MLDLKQVELVYSSSFFKSIETGGNVSRALVSLIQYNNNRIARNFCFFVVLNFRYQVLKAYFRGLIIVCPEHVIIVAYSLDFVG